MDVRYTAEQAALRDSVAQIVDRFGPRAVGQLDVAERALKLDATYMPPLYHIGRIASVANANLPRGEETLRKYLSGYTPKENEPTIANAHYWLGAVLEKEGKKAEAKKSYEAALKLNPALKQATEALKRVS